MKEKNQEIQLLRAIAIFMVVSYHFFCRQASLLSFQNTFNFFPLKYCWLGVHLFFIISRFVITMTTTNPIKISTFLLNRIFKIYPPLFLILPLVCFIQFFLPYSPYKHLSNFINLMFSVLMIPPNIFNFTLSMNINWVTLVLWSLKVEIFFYLIFCFLRFKSFNTERNLSLLSYFGLIPSLLVFIHKSPELLGLKNIFEALCLNYLIYFYIGNLLFRNKNSKVKKMYLYVAEIACLCNGYIVYKNWSVIILLGILLGICNILLLNSRQSFYLPLFLKNIADSSYEMYLFHQGFGVTLLIFASNALELNGFLCFLFSLFLIAFCYFFSFIIFSRVTNPLNKSLRIRFAP